MKNLNLKIFIIKFVKKIEKQMFKEFIIHSQGIVFKELVTLKEYIDV